MNEFHEPVLTDEIIYWMNLKEDGLYCDCTVGGGGHLTAMLEKTKKARFIGIDCDPDAFDHSSRKLKIYDDRVTLCQTNFARLDFILDDLKIAELDGVLFDLGVSWYQLSTPERGFSFNHNGTLLMQMSPEVMPLYEKIRRASIKELYEVLKEYGDLPMARKTAQLIFNNRSNILTTFDLRELIERTYPKRFLKKNLQRIFQALRIWVNDELNNLRQGLIKAVARLAPFGRLVAIAYHSGEDRIVKNTLIEFERFGKMKRLNKKVIRPSPAEIDSNPRARSARMRVGEKCA